MTYLAHYKSVWLVGASSGIGAALVDALDAPGRRIFVSARNREALDKLKEGKQSEIISVPMDMTSEAQTLEVVEKIRSDGGIDMLILNAGTCEYMDSHDLDLELLERVMETNFFSITRLIKHGLSLLRASKVTRPQLVVMSSSVSYQALPRAHAYGASKAALRYFAECVKADVQLEGIDVRVVSPGFVETPLTDRNDFPMPFKVSSEQAAKTILNGLEGRRFDVHFPRRFTWPLKLFARLPDWLRFKLLGGMSRHEEAMSSSGRSHEKHSVADSQSR